VLAGIFFAAGVLGSVAAFICGGFMLELYTHFDTIDTSSSVSNTDLYKYSPDAVPPIHAV